MGYLNLTSSIRYGPHGKRRKTKAFTKKSKKQKYLEMIEQQQKVFDRVVREVSETEKIPSALLKGGGGGQKNLEWEREKLKIYMYLPRSSLTHIWVKLKMLRT